MKRKFFSKWDAAPVSPSVVGSPVRPVYSGHFDDNGHVVVEQTDEVDVYQEIQSYRDQCDINSIMERYGVTHDGSILEQVEGFYADVSDLPTSYMDALNQIEATKQFFEGLPANIKERFDNSYSVFIAAADKPDFLDIFKVDESSEDVPAQPLKEGVENES